MSEMNDAEKLRSLAQYLNAPLDAEPPRSLGTVSGLVKDLRRIADDLERKAVSDEDIEEAFPVEADGNYERNLANVFKQSGARWMREKLNGKS